MPRSFQLLAKGVAVATLAACCFGTATLAQDAPPTAMVIVDGSGSMWGNLGTDKRPKLEIGARRTARAAAEPAPRGAHRARLIRPSPPRQLR